MSGNRGSRFGIAAPACIHAAVAVGSVYSRSFGPFTAFLTCRDATTAADQVSCFSNASTQLDLLAPGAAMVSTALGGGLASFAGTSAASAEAAGAAALLLQADPSLSAAEVEAALETTGVPITDPRTHAVVPRLDVAAALASVLGRPVPFLPAPPATTPAPAPTLAAPTLPEIELRLSPIGFGRVPVGRTAHRTLAIGDTGAGYLTVRLDPVAAPFAARPAKLVVPPGGRATLELSFRPPAAGAYSRVLRLRTDDRSAAVIGIRIQGSGVRA